MLEPVKPLTTFTPKRCGGLRGLDQFLGGALAHASGLPSP